jgi:hypothetical protein
MYYYPSSEVIETHMDQSWTSQNQLLQILLPSFNKKISTTNECLHCLQFVRKDQHVHQHIILQNQVYLKKKSRVVVHMSLLLLCDNCM